MHVAAVCVVEGADIHSNASNILLKRGFLGFGKVWWARLCSLHVLQPNISHCPWMMLFAKELIRDSENQSMEMKSRRGTIFLVFYRTWEEIIMLLVEKLLCNDLLGRYPYVSLE